jgi:hypothetical protein
VAERRAHPPEPGDAGDSARVVRLKPATRRTLPPAANDNAVPLRRAAGLVLPFLIAAIALALLLGGVAG